MCFHISTEVILSPSYQCMLDGWMCVWGGGDGGGGGHGTSLFFLYHFLFSLQTSGQNTGN